MVSQLYTVLREIFAMIQLRMIIMPFDHFGQPFKSVRLDKFWSQVYHRRPKPNGSSPILVTSREPQTKGSEGSNTEADSLTMTE